jgi:hypothetical protein
LLDYSSFEKDAQYPYWGVWLLLVCLVGSVLGLGGLDIPWVTLKSSNWKVGGSLDAIEVRV